MAERTGLERYEVRFLWKHLPNPGSSSGGFYNTEDEATAALKAYTDVPTVERAWVHDLFNGQPPT